MCTTAALTAAPPRMQAPPPPGARLATMGCYCGCGTRNSKIRWLAAILLGSAAIACIVAFVGLVVKCTSGIADAKDLDDDDRAHHAWPCPCKFFFFFFFFSFFFFSIQILTSFGSCPCVLQPGTRRRALTRAAACSVRDEI